MKKKSWFIIYEIQQLNVRWYTHASIPSIRHHFSVLPHLAANWNLIRTHADVCIQLLSVQHQFNFLLIKKLGKWVVEHRTYAQKWKRQPIELDEQTITSFSFIIIDNATKIVWITFQFPFWQFCRVLRRTHEIFSTAIDKTFGISVWINWCHVTKSLTNADGWDICYVFFLPQNHQDDDEIMKEEKNIQRSCSDNVNVM